MAFKLQRNFELRIEYVENGVSRFQIITMPQTIEFSVNRNSLFALNEASIKIYNLSPESRTRIRKDAWNFQQIRRVLFLAGYGDNLRTVFYGVVMSAQSYRMGADFVTEIIALDGGGTITTNYTGVFRKGQQRQELLNQLVDSIVNANIGVSRGAIAPIEGEFQKDTAFSGNGLDVLNIITNGGVFLDNMRIFYLRDNQYIRSGIEVLNSTTGLLGTPKIGEATIEVTMLFEPNLLVGQQLRLDSTEASAGVSPLFRGDYKVTAIYHSGTISGAVGGSCTTTAVMNIFAAVEGKQEIVLEGGR